MSLLAAASPTIAVAEHPPPSLPNMTAFSHAAVFPAPQRAGGRVGAGRAAQALRCVGPELAFKVKGSPAVLSMAVRGRFGD
ncbi:hypothetical protein E6C76_11510 [Pseudothauera nasutitermitis]|uniref:Uncharacterized protein n=1 Tax=Pseudothauera nasutitermitis TaxID=2565930 RepID=A0A4S4AZ79_9RHOO|nr:hypothetical protein [Pseudothauera nasutitermitis]THF64671.1 hypothetical protein E6C76_11510 [Pseudothauera nasutitermitis]